MRTVLIVSDDPPFHLLQRTPRPLPVRTNSDTQGLRVPSLRPMQSVQSSSSGEFRSVIDDLTVENKKLRQRLKLYERSHAAHLHPDRMFEVRMPGLAGKDKTRLERILKDFADSISGSDMAYPRPASKKKSKAGSHKQHASSTNSAPAVDSAYASGSGSAGNNSGTQAQQEARATASDSTSNEKSSTYGSNNRVYSYLHDMGQGLLPKRRAAMSEKARRKEVVKRLEALFTGKAKTRTRNSQPAQQQEVSNAAANADKRANEAKGSAAEPEGSREAPILRTDAEAAMLQSDANGKTKDRVSPVEGSDVVGADQRPTRPLDLDLNRAQNAADNLAYIRHLGLNPGEATDNDDVDVDGWVWLNLLMSMAQLHTVNVTPEFVRRAVKEVSDKFELSPDGSKVRWLGGADASAMSADSGSNYTDSPGNLAQDQRLPRSRDNKLGASGQLTGILKSSGTDTDSGIKSSSRDVSASTEGRSVRQPNGKRPVFIGQTTRGNPFQYEPMFLHGANSDTEGDYFLGENDSMNSSGLREELTASGGSSQPTRRIHSTRPSRGDAPMIFYHRARFVIDLSGDQDVTPMCNTAYATATNVALGARPPIDRSPSHESRGTLCTDLPSSSADMGNPLEEDLPVLKLFGNASKTPSRNSEPLDLPVSGLGGVMPAENLVFHVKHKQIVTKRKQPPSAANDRYRKYAHHVRSRLFNGDKSLLNRISSQAAQEVRLEGTGPVAHTELAPSELPPPSYAYMAFGSSNEDESWGSDDASEANDDLIINDNDAFQMPDFVPPAPMLTHEETATGYESDESDDEESDGEVEVDMLGHERELHADDVAERERAWEEGNRSPTPGASPASSNATVGDQSFLSDEEDGEKTSGRDELRGSQRAGSKRGHEEVEGSMQVMGSPAKRIQTPRTKGGRK